MLKDLDQRQQPHALSGVPQNTQTQARSLASWQLLLLGLLAGALLVAAGFYGWSVFNRNHEAGTTQAPLVVKTDTVTAPSSASTTVAMPKTADNQVAASLPTATPEVTTPQLTTHADEKSAPQLAVASPVSTPVTVAADVPAVNAETSMHTIAKDVNNNASFNAKSAIEPKQAVAQPEPAPKMATAQPSGKMEISEVKLTPEQLAQRQYQAGMNAQQNGDLIAAAAAMQRALELYPALHSARKQLAALYYGAGQLTEAAALLQLGINNFPSQQQFWLLLGRVQLAQGKSAAAQASLQHIADGSELATDKWLTLAKLGQQDSNWTLVQQSYQRLIASAADDGRWWMGLAHAQDAAGDYPSALASYRQALQRDNLSLNARAYIENRIAQIGDRQ
jgi:MSHA biogenesis protein MshN